MLIELRNVTKVYGSGPGAFRALDGVSRDLSRSAARRSGVRTFADADEGYLATDIVESDRGSSGREMEH